MNKKNSLNLNAQKKKMFSKKYSLNKMKKRRGTNLNIN